MVAGIYTLEIPTRTSRGEHVRLNLSLERWLGDIPDEGLLPDPSISLLPVPEGSKAKPKVAIMSGGKTMCEISARMNNYDDMVWACSKDIASIDVNLRNSKYNEGEKYVNVYIRLLDDDTRPSGAHFA